MFVPLLTMITLLAVPMVGWWRWWDDDGNDDDDNVMMMMVIKWKLKVNS